MSWFHQNSWDELMMHEMTPQTKHMLKLRLSETYVCQSDKVHVRPVKIGSNLLLSPFQITERFSFS
jgi:hypothetical protein